MVSTESAQRKGVAVKDILLRLWQRLKQSCLAPLYTQNTLVCGLFSLTYLFIDTYSFVSHITISKDSFLCISYIPIMLS